MNTDSGELPPIKPAAKAFTDSQAIRFPRIVTDEEDENFRREYLQYKVLPLNDSATPNDWWHHLTNALNNQTKLMLKTKRGAEAQTRHVYSEVREVAKTVDTHTKQLAQGEKTLKEVRAVRSLIIWGAIAIGTIISGAVTIILADKAKDIHINISSTPSGAITNASATSSQ